MNLYPELCLEFFPERKVLRPWHWVPRSRFRQALRAAPIIGALMACQNLPAQQNPDAALYPVVSSTIESDPFNALSSTAGTGIGDSRNAPDNPDELPDTPQIPPKGAADAHVPPNSVESESIPQTKRILGIIPNFRAISTDKKLPPQSVKEKFVTATQDSFDYSSVFVPAVLAYYSLETNATPEFGQGAVGYGRYFWHSAVDQTSENYMVEFVVPAITHEDTRYYTLGRGGFLKRTGYALSRAVVTRSDAGNEVFNVSEVVGAGASAGLSSLYYPTRERSLGNTGSEWGLDIGIDAASFVAKEFWPDINHWLFRSAKLPPIGQQ